MDQERVWLFSWRPARRCPLSRVQEPDQAQIPAGRVDLHSRMTFNRARRPSAEVVGVLVVAQGRDGLRLRLTAGGPGNGSKVLELLQEPARVADGWEGRRDGKGDGVRPGKAGLATGARLNPRPA